MNDPNVPTYRSDMIQVCGSRDRSSAAPVSLRTGARLSMNSAAQAAAITISGM